MYLARVCCDARVQYIRDIRNDIASRESASIYILLQYIYITGSNKVEKRRKRRKSACCIYVPEYLLSFLWVDYATAVWAVKKYVRYFNKSESLILLIALRVYSVRNTFARKGDKSNRMHQSNDNRVIFFGLQIFNNPINKEIEYFFRNEEYKTKTFQELYYYNSRKNYEHNQRYEYTGV